MLNLLKRADALLARMPWDIAGLALRLFPAWTFWASGQTKIEGFSIKESTYFLFEHEYALPLIPSKLAAVMATSAELTLPILLVLGFGTRLAALALLGMTTVIQVFVYPDAWPVHGIWAACFLGLISGGPGRLSLDALLLRNSGETGAGMTRHV